jgi:hypothetical protein
MATSKQMTKLLSVFDGVETEQMQQILGSGVLAVVRDRPDLVKKFIKVAHGICEVRPVSHVIDLDADPYVPEGWSVLVHRKGGQLEWNPEKVQLYLSPKQEDGRSILGLELREKLENELWIWELNANLLDDLLANPHHIPEEWKGKRIYFWGTIYVGSDGGLYVRYLYDCGEEWTWCPIWVGNSFGVNDPALVLVRLGK